MTRRAQPAKIVTNLGCTTPNTAAVVDWYSLSQAGAWHLDNKDISAPCGRAESRNGSCNLKGLNADFAAVL